MELAPNKLLSSLIQSYWYFEKTYDASNDFEVILPDGYCDLVLCYSQNNLFCYYIGLQTQRLKIHQQGKMRFFGIRFFPYSLHFFKIHNSENDINQIFTGEKIFSNTNYGYLKERIGMLPFNEIALELDKYFLSILDIKPNVRFLYKAHQTIRNSSGTITIQDLSNSLCLSKRSLERKFEKHIGLTPKAYSKIVRFNAAKNDLTLGDGSTKIFETVHKYGYYDQSHFIAEFKSHSGLTPTAFLEKLSPFS